MEVVNANCDVTSVYFFIHTRQVCGRSNVASLRAGRAVKPLNFEFKCLLSKVTIQKDQLVHNSLLIDMSDDELISQQLSAVMSYGRQLCGLV